MVGVKVHRIQLINDIENYLEEEADWRYTITVRARTVTTQGYELKESRDDVRFAAKTPLRASRTKMCLLQ